MTLALVSSMLALVFGLANRYDGADHQWLSTRALCLGVCAFAASAVYAGLHYDAELSLVAVRALLVAIAVFGGLLIWRAPGHGHAFIAQYGRRKKDRFGKWEQENYLLDWIAGKISGKPDGIAYGFVYATLRGLFVVPLFLALAFPLASPLVVWGGLVGSLKGFWYWLPARLISEQRQGENYTKVQSIPNAWHKPLREMFLIPGAMSEFLEGAAIGAMVGLAMVVSA